MNRVMASGEAIAFGESFQIAVVVPAADCFSESVVDADYLREGVRPMAPGSDGVGGNHEVLGCVVHGWMSLSALVLA